MIRKLQMMICAATMIVAGQAKAGTLVVGFDPGVTNVTTALTGFATSGDMMDGMIVKAIFTDMSSEMLAWADIAAGSGGVFGTGWSLRQDGDTFDNGSWTLSNVSALAIQSIAIDAGAGDTIFDIDEPSSGTAGSAGGRTFDIVSGGDPFDVVATYSDIVALTGDPPVGDLWRRLLIDFTDTPFTADSVLRFGADTDNSALEGDVNPGVPEPTSLAIFAVIGIAAMGRRSRTSKR